MYKTILWRQETHILSLQYHHNDTKGHIKIESCWRFHNEILILFNFYYKVNKRNCFSLNKNPNYNEYSYTGLNIFLRLQIHNIDTTGR